MIYLLQYLLPRDELGASGWGKGLCQNSKDGGYNHMIEASSFFNMQGFDHAVMIAILTSLTPLTRMLPDKPFCKSFVLFICRLLFLVVSVSEFVCFFQAYV